MTLGMLYKLTREHALDADDIRALLAVGVSRDQIGDALAVCFPFTTVRLADAFGFFLPGPKAFEAGAKYLSFRILPCSTHKARFTAGEDLHDSVQVTGLGFRGFQHGEVAKNLLFAARNQGIPSTLSRRIFSQGQAEQLRQRVGRSAPIGVIERQIDRHSVSDFAARRVSHRLM
jgi:hypothetical protein